MAVETGGITGVGIKAGTGAWGRAWVEDAVRSGAEIGAGSTQGVILGYRADFLIARDCGWG